MGPPWVIVADERRQVTWDHVASIFRVQIPSPGLSDPRTYSLHHVVLPQMNQISSLIFLSFLFFVKDGFTQKNQNQPSSLPVITLYCAYLFPE